MEKFVYRPRGVCSSLMEFMIEDGVIKDLKITGGCDGNLKGIIQLVKGCKVDEVIEKLENIKCGFKNTSCPDQISKALKEYKNNEDNIRE